jgi:biopolymer transport protein ExbD
MNHRILAASLLTCALFSGPPAVGAEGPDTRMRTAELATEVAALLNERGLLARQVADVAEPERLRLRLRLVDLEGRLEQAGAEQALLKTVTEKTVPAAVVKEVAVKKLAARAKATQKRADLLEEAVKQNPGDARLALDRLDAEFERKQARAEHDFLREGVDGPDSNAFLLKSLKARSGGLKARLEEVRSRLAEARGDRESALLLRQRVLELEFQIKAADQEAEARGGDRPVLWIGIDLGPRRMPVYSFGPGDGGRPALPGDQGVPTRERLLERLDAALTARAGTDRVVVQVRADPEVPVRVVQELVAELEKRRDTVLRIDTSVAGPPSPRGTNEGPRPVRLKAWQENGRSVIAVEGQEVKENDLAAALERYVRDGRGELVVETGEGLPAGVLAGILDAAKAAGVKKVIHARQQP